MNEYIKYVESGGENICFIIKDDSILIKYNEISNKIERTFNINVHSIPVYDKIYIKAKVRE